ncbi:MAG: serine/threonine-protein kinase [Solirubrobacteraceae bacterium]|jgi:serine/threonine protein kinase
MAGFSPGAAFAGYTIDGLIARGGMGYVYRATEMRPRRAIALKIITPELAAEPGFRARFLSEAQLAAEIEHPHVVPVLRVGEEDGMLFIAMRLIHGTDLAAVIKTSGRLEPARTAQIVDQIADALDTAHEKGLIHRDVKPANVLIEVGRRGEHAYLTDFGVTKHAGSTSGVTSTGVVVGTVDYMAPEQLEGGTLDSRADVYSLGCVMFEALTGRVPFPHEGRAARMYAILASPPPSVCDLAPDLPRQLEDVVRRALAKKPDDRYQSAGDLARAALAAAELTSVPARPRGPSPADATAPLSDASLSETALSARAGFTRTRIIPTKRGAADDDTVRRTARPITEPPRSGAPEPTASPPRRRRRWRRWLVSVPIAAAVAIVLSTTLGSSPSIASIAKAWLQTVDAGNFARAAGYWSAPAYWTGLNLQTQSLETQAQVRLYIERHSTCHRRLARTVVSSTPDVVRLVVFVDGALPGKTCTSQDTERSEDYLVIGGHIVSAQFFLINSPPHPSNATPQPKPSTKTTAKASATTPGTTTSSPPATTGTSSVPPATTGTPAGSSGASAGSSAASAGSSRASAGGSGASPTASSGAPTTPATNAPATQPTTASAGVTTAATPLPSPPYPGRG